MTLTYIPYGTFNGIPFDWGQNQPQKERRNGADYYTGTIICYTQSDFDAIWALRTPVNVRAVGDATQTVYIDTWQPIASVQHTLSMSSGREQHLAILTDIQMQQRVWQADRSTNLPTVIALQARAEFLLLS